MFDPFKNHGVDLTAPASHAEAITPNDTAPLEHATRGLYSGTGGDVRFTTVEGDTITLTGLLPGVIYGLRVSHVLSTGTTASGLVGLR